MPGVAYVCKPVTVSRLLTVVLVGAVPVTVAGPLVPSPESIVAVTASGRVALRLSLAEVGELAGCHALGKCLPLGGGQAHDGARCTGAAEQDLAVFHCDLCTLTRLAEARFTPRQKRLRWPHADMCHFSAF